MVPRSATGLHGPAAPVSSPRSAEKQAEYLRDILSSGKHLLSLINDILDLSKIEAGRMELDLSDFDAAQAIGDAMLLMRERAARQGIELEQVVDDRSGQITADERKFKQVLLNLLFECREVYTKRRQA